MTVSQRKNKDEAKIAAQEQTCTQTHERGCSGPLRNNREDPDDRNGTRISTKNTNATWIL